MKRLRAIAVLPTLFTLGNLVCGFFAIVVSSRIDAPTSGVAPTAAELARASMYSLWRFDPTDPTHNILIAVCLIFLAMLFDALDGHVARLAKSTTDFGAELDSLADVVSFGVAPALLMVKMCPTFAYFHREAVWIIAATYAACAALRLARFNAESDENDDHSTFRGLPSPAAAASVAGFALIFYMLRREDTGLAYAQQIDSVLQTVLPLFALFVGMLMVSRIPYPHFVNNMLRAHRGFGFVVGIVFAVAAVMFIPWLTIPLICIAFALGGPAKFVWNLVWKKEPQEEAMF